MKYLFKEEILNLSSKKPNIAIGQENKGIKLPLVNANKTP